MHHSHLLLALVSSCILAQTPTSIVVKPTPLMWLDANNVCGNRIYPVPATPTDAVYDLLDEQTEYDRWWVQRRGATTCTYLDRNGEGLRLGEASCYELLPFFCQGF